MSLYKIQKLSKNTHQSSNGKSKSKSKNITSSCECGKCSFSSECSSHSVCKPDTNYSPIRCEIPECEEVRCESPLECGDFEPCERKPVPKCPHKHECDCSSDSESDCEISDCKIPECPKINICPEPPCPPKNTCCKPECDFSPIRINIKKPCKPKIRIPCKSKFDDSIPCVKPCKPQKIKPIKTCRISFPKLPDCEFNVDTCIKESEQPRIPHKAKGCCDKVKKFTNCDVSKPKCLKKIRSDEVHEVENLQFPTIKAPKF